MLKSYLRMLSIFFGSFRIHEGTMRKWNTKHDMKGVTMRKLPFYGCLFIPVLLLAGQSPLKDHPSKGNWNFDLEKIWEVDKAGDEDFGRIAELLVSEQKNIFVRDFKNNVSYIFDDGGRFVKKFAPKGNEPGQLSHYLNRFQAGEKIVLAAPEKLHYFTQDGAFDHAADNNLFIRFPLTFLNENEFIYAPNLPQSPVHERKLKSFNLLSGEEKLLLDFSDPENPDENFIQGLMVMIFGLIPQVDLVSDGEKIMFGRNDQYKIFTADPTGKILSFFSLDRKKMKASAEDKRNHFSGSSIPKETLEKIVTQLPDEMTFFSHIDAMDGYIYVFSVTGIGNKTTSQQIDIFSEKGEYLYRGEIKFGDNLKFGSPSNLVLGNGYLTVILENDQGELKLAKYRIKLPQ